MPKKSLDAGFDLPETPPEKPRTPIAEKNAHRFVSGKRAVAATSARLRRDGVGDCERLNVYIPSEIAASVRERAFRERRSLSDAVSDALESWLKKHSSTKAP